MKDTIQAAHPISLTIGAPQRMAEDQTYQHPASLHVLMIKGQQAQTGISSVQPNCTKQVVQVTTYIRSMLLPHSGSVQNGDNKLVALSKQQVGSTKYHTT